MTIPTALKTFMKMTKAQKVAYIQSNPTQVKQRLVDWFKIIYDKDLRPEFRVILDRIKARYQADPNEFLRQLKNKFNV